MLKYKQGDRVFFTLSADRNGWGKVCGLVGPVIIIELEQPLEKYDFTHIYVLDTQISGEPHDPIE